MSKIKDATAKTKGRKAEGKGASRSAGKGAAGTGLSEAKSTKASTPCPFYDRGECMYPGKCGFLAAVQEPVAPKKPSIVPFICFTNLMLSSSGSGNEGSQTSIHFLKHFITDDIAQIEWRMDFFDKLFERVLP